MQAFVYSVFVVVSTVIAALLAAGFSGILILLITDDGRPHGSTGHKPGADRSADLVVQRAQGSVARPAHSTALRTSP